MKRLIPALAIVLFSALALAQDKTATTEDGKTVILKANGTWLYADDQNQKGQKDKADDYAAAPRIIQNKCEKEWPTDFSVRVYCIDKEREAVKKLKRGRPADITATDYATVHNKCAEEWPRDFGVREYCEQNEFEAIRKLRDQKRN